MATKKTLFTLCLTLALVSNFNIWTANAANFEKQIVVGYTVDDLKIFQNENNAPASKEFLNAREQILNKVADALEPHEARLGGILLKLRRLKKIDKFVINILASPQTISNSTRRLNEESNNISDNLTVKGDSASDNIALTDHDEVTQKIGTVDDQVFQKPDRKNVGRALTNKILEYVDTSLWRNRQLIGQQTRGMIAISGGLRGFVGLPKLTQLPFGLGLGVGIGLIYRDKKIEDVFIDLEWGKKAYTPTVIVAGALHAQFILDSETEPRSLSEWNQSFLPGGPTFGQTEAGSSLAPGFALGASLPPIISSFASFRMKTWRWKLPVLKVSILKGSQLENLAVVSPGLTECACALARMCGLY